MTYGGATNPCAQYTYSFILYNYKKRFVTMKICIFCSANQQLDPDFFGMTEELGRWLATEGHTLVYGGVNSGLMECVARAVKQAGGRTVGVIPKIVELVDALCAMKSWVLPAHDHVDGKFQTETGKDYIVKSSENAGLQVTKKFAVKAQDIEMHAQSSFKEYSMTHEINANQSANVTATGTIDIKAQIIREG